MSFQLPQHLARTIQQLALETGRDVETVVTELLIQAVSGAIQSNSDYVLNVALQQQLVALEQCASTLAMQLLEFRHHSLLDAVTLNSVRDLEQEIDTLLTLSNNISVGTIDQGPTADQDDSLIQPAIDVQLAKTLDQIFSVSPDVVLVQDRLGRLMYVNSAGAQVFGGERSFFIGKTFHDLRLPIETIELLTTQCQDVSNRKQLLRGDTCFPTAYQSIRNYEYLFSPICSSDADIHAVVFIARDITEHDRAKSALQESEEKYRLLFDAANDSILISNFSTGQLLNANWSAARQLGYSRRELLQLTLNQIEASMDEGDRTNIRRKLEMDGSTIYEHAYCRKDGTLIPIEVSAQVIEYEDCLAVQSFARDITDRKQAEAALHQAHVELAERASELEASNEELQSALENLREAEEELVQQNEALEVARVAAQVEQQRYRDLFDFAPDGYLVMDDEAVVQEANLAAASLLGIQRQFLAGKPFSLFVDPQHHSRFNLYLSQLHLQSQTQTWELTLKSLSGESFAAAVTMSAIWYATGDLKGFRCMVRDITTLKRAEAKIRTLNNELEQRVIERTAELLQANRELANEIAERQRVEQALRASEEKFSSAFRSSPSAITISLLPDGRYIEVNESFYDLTGYTAAEAIGRTATEMGLWVNLDERAWFIQQLQQEGIVRNFESAFRTRSGQLKIALKSAEVIYLDDQACALVVTKDITERKRLEIALQESQAKLNAILNSTIGAITSVRVFPDHTWEYEYFSAGSEQVFGYTVQEMIANPMLLVSRLCPTQREHVFQSIIHTATTEGTSTIEYKFYRKDEVFRWIETSFSSRWDEGSRCWVVTGLSNDITTRKQAEEAMRDSEACFRAVFELTTVAINKADSTGRIVQANRRFCELLGYTEAELEQRTFWDITHPDDCPANLDYSRQLWAGEISSFLVRKRYIRKDGQLLWVRVHVSLVHFLGYPPQYSVGVIEEVEEHAL